MIEEDQDRHVPSSWQYRDVEVDIDDPDIRRLIDEYRKPKTKQDRIKAVRAEQKGKSMKLSRWICKCCSI